MRSPVGGHELRQLEGNAEKIWERGDKWVKLSNVMESTATELAAIGDSSVHKSKGTDKLAEMAAESVDDLKKAAVRYDETGRALRKYGNALDTAKTWLRNNMADVEAAELAYQSAIDAKADAKSAQDSLERVWVWEDDPTQTELNAARDAVADANGALDSAETKRDELWTAFDQVFEKWSAAYDDAVEDIQKAMESAKNNDGFWEFVDSALNVIAIVMIVLSVIALIIGAPLVGLLGMVLLGLTLLTVALTALKFAFGRATLSDLAWSLVGLLPFGIGKILSKGAPVLSTIIRSGRGTVTGAIRAGLPQVALRRPTTWVSPLRSLVAPVRSWLALPRPGMFVNPFRSLAMGGSEAVQVQNFLNTMRSSQWGSNPAVRDFIVRTTGTLPGRGEQILNVGLWTSFTANDALGVAGLQPDIPVLEDIQVPWGR
jgi:tetratricopeptide (TPR) repeat protein